MKKRFPTFIEETAQLLGAMIVSAGRVGLQAELSPGDLARIAGAAFRDLV
jgi:Cys-tRNA(Pro)/Cys-tRNA(Cys) deacylase